MAEEYKIAVITIPVMIPMSKSVLKKTGFSGDILEMTMNEYEELKETFVVSEKAE